MHLSKGQVRGEACPEAHCTSLDLTADLNPLLPTQYTHGLIALQRTLRSVLEYHGRRRRGRTTCRALRL